MPRLLLTEDDRSLRDLLAQCFQEEHFEVGTAATMAGGVELLESSEPFDLILTDLFLRAFSPEDLVHLEAYRSAAPDVPIIVMTGHGEALQVDPSRYGLADIVAKPFDLEDLLARMRQAIALQDTRRASMHTRSADAREKLRASNEHIDASRSLLERIQGTPELPPEA